MLFNFLVQHYYFEFDFWHLKNAGNRNLHNFDSKPFQTTKDVKMSAIKKMMIIMVTFVHYEDFHDNGRPFAISFA